MLMQELSFNRILLVVLAALATFSIAYYPIAIEIAPRRL